MLQAGYVFCHRCGRATEEAYYYNSEINVWVQLKRTLFGKFAVERYTPQSLRGTIQAESAIHIDRFVLAVFTETPQAGLPHTITVDCYAGSRMDTIKFYRSCPFCIGQQQAAKEKNKKVQELISGLGQLPTYVIGVIGARTVGKSCWIHALNSPANLRKINSQRDGGEEYEGYVLMGTEFAEDRSVRPEATPLNSLGNTRILKIQKKSGRQYKEVAQLLVLDFAGELFARNKKQAFEETTAHFFKGGAGFSGVDAVVFMMEPMDLDEYHQLRERREDAEQYSLANTYNVVNGDWSLLTKKPVAFVMNKVDLLFDNPPKIRIGNAHVPRFTAETFEKQGLAMYQKYALLPRIALETELLRQMSSLVDAAVQQNECAGFFIKATTPIYDKDGVLTHVNFVDSINVLDPLLWILNKLDVFPIDDQTN